MTMDGIIIIISIILNMKDTILKIFEFILKNGQKNSNHFALQICIQNTFLFYILWRI